MKKDRTIRRKQRKYTLKEIKDIISRACIIYSSDENLLIEEECAVSAYCNILREEFKIIYRS